MADLGGAAWPGLVFLVAGAALVGAAVEVAPTTMIHAAVAAHSERYRSAGVRIDASLADSTPRVLVDPERIQEVLGSLLDNALRCTPAGGTVTIAGRPSPSGDSAVITVTDTGLGLTPAETGQIFRRFAKAADSPGSGLGLTIARAIVEAHHGTLTADSAGPGTGARFTITLPASRSYSRPPTEGRRNWQHPVPLIHSLRRIRPWRDRNAVWLGIKVATTRNFKPSQPASALNAPESRDPGPSTS